MIACDILGIKGYKDQWVQMICNAEANAFVYVNVDTFGIL